MTDKSAALRIEGATKRFGKHLAVDNASFHVQPGEIVGLLGPNGAGKTTLLGIVVSWLHADAGQVFINGSLSHPNRNEALKNVGVLVGQPGLVPQFSARKNLILMAEKLQNLPATRIDEVLEQVSLTNAADRRVSGFSTGMRQRLGLAIALLKKPSLLILDEPMNGLDPVGVRVLRDLLSQFAEQGMAILFSTHLLHDVQAIAQRAVIMNHGKVIAQDSISNLTSAHHNLEERFLEMLK